MLYSDVGNILSFKPIEPAQPWYGHSLMGDLRKMIWFETVEREPACLFTLHNLSSLPYFLTSSMRSSTISVVSDY